MLKRAIVIGASSGMGAALVRRLVGEGYRVAAVARRADMLQQVAEPLNRGEQRVWTYAHDVCDTSSAPDLFRDIVATLDGLDVVVYSSGVMPVIREDEFDAEIDRKIVEVNVIGAMSWLNLAASRFQVQRGGMIVGIGSVAGERGRRGNPAYCASKAALHTYLESLRNRLSRFGVHVLTVKPGPVRTPMTAHVEKMPLMISAEEAADQIFSAMARRVDTAFVPLPWVLIMSVVRAIPSIVFRRMSF